MAQVNSINVEELRDYVVSAERDAAVADRDPVPAEDERRDTGPACRAAPCVRGGVAGRRHAQRHVAISLQFDAS